MSLKTELNNVKGKLKDATAALHTAVEEHESLVEDHRVLESQITELQVSNQNLLKGVLEGTKVNGSQHRAAMACAAELEKSQRNVLKLGVIAVLAVATATVLALGVVWS